MELSPKEMSKVLINDGLELTLERLSLGVYGGSNSKDYISIKKWCDTQQSLESNKDSKDLISLAKDSNKIALEANNVALEANLLAEAANRLAVSADERASRAESRAREAIYIALGTLIIQAVVYITSSI
jgi:hypothetical protein